jgi:hypothetical protein
VYKNSVECTAITKNDSKDRWEDQSWMESYFITNSRTLLVQGGLDGYNKLGYILCKP